MYATLALPAAFFLSGAAGLIFQVVWFYLAGLVFGSSLASVTTVLTGFMAGLAAGNALAARMGTRVSRPLRAYARLEVVVALSGLVATLLLPRVSAALIPLARAAGEHTSIVNVVRLAAAVLVLGAPSTAMGATLPLLVGALCRQGTRFGAALGRFYGWNTCGAVAGVVAAEVWLIASVGIRGTAVVAALLNLGAAFLATRAAQDEPTQAPVASSTGAGPDRSVATLLAAAALCGALLLGLEVVWFRFLSMYVLITTLATSLMLAVVLCGIALGGALAGIGLRRGAAPAGAVPVAAAIAGLAVIGSYSAFQATTSGTQVGAWTTVLWFACVLTLPVACVSGALFTLLGDAVRQCGRADVAAAGWLTLANTAGAAAGPPLAAWVWLPHAGMEGTFFVFALGYGLVALLAGLAGATPSVVSARAWTHDGRKAGLVATAVLVLASFTFPFGTMARTYFARAAAAYGGDGSTIVAVREGVADTLFVMQQRWLGQPVYSRLVTNGYSMSGTALQGQRYMRAFAYYPMLLHGGPIAKALVICYGVGVTLGAVEDIPSVAAIDVAEISRDITAMSDAIYPPGHRPLDDPRVRLHVEDGRFFLQTTTERYDLITGEPPPPRTPGTVNIYTREFFELVHARLNEGGIASYWVPVARPNPGTDVNTIIRAFCDVFSDCTLWNATPFDLMLVGSRGGTGQRTLQQFSAPWQTPGLEAKLREVGFERPEQIGATFVGDASVLTELTRATPPLTDDFPQRLRPSARASLSDPRYGRSDEVTRMFDDLIDVESARRRFESSSFIRATWPTDLVERTRPYFTMQAVLNGVYWSGARPLATLPQMDQVLASTTLRTLPLWMLGTDEVRQRITETSGDASGQVEYARGLRALSGRDFAGAATWLERAVARGFNAPTVRGLADYARAKAAPPLPSPSAVQP